MYIQIHTGGKIVNVLHLPIFQYSILTANIYRLSNFDDFDQRDFSVLHASNYHDLHYQQKTVSILQSHIKGKLHKTNMYFFK